MHFSIPDTSEKTDGTGSTYTVFNLHINGVYHCSARYSLFHSFHDQLKKQFGAAELPAFPPKKFKLIPLTPSELDDRRAMIERYIQLLSQNAEIASSDAFNGFLLSAQQESQQEVVEDVALDVYLMNGHKITVDILSVDQTDTVLEAVASKIQLPDDFVYYFGLFLIKKEDGKDNAIVRKLQEFESPYISLKAAANAGAAGTDHRIVLRKCYWDISIDEVLMEDRVAMNLLHVQAVNDLERGWVAAGKDQQRQLDTLRQRGSMKEYLRLARTLKYYGYIQFKPCVVDYPQPDCRAVIRAGSKELNFRVHVSRDEVKEASFKVTRMRCWRITTMIPESGSGEDPRTVVPSRLELAFEYLMGADSLRWVTISSDQAILLSMCLQGMVDELIRKKKGERIKRPTDRLNSGPRRRGSSSSSQPAGMRRQSSTASATSIEPSENGSVPNSGVPRVRKISEKTTTVKRSLSSNGGGLVGVTAENDAFEGIGDDDL